VAAFVDTSALIALLDADEASHAPVRDAWATLAGSGERLVTSNYVVVETVAVLQRRFGMPAVRDLVDALLPLLELHWVDPPLHDAALRALRTADRRSLSLVDLTSFELMRELDLRVALALDPHFAEQGFDLRPALDAVHEP
jgi:predicted nucleic acid-binding protein